MINSTDILTAWQRLGWLEPSKIGYKEILNTDNKTTLSGLTFDSLHPLCDFIRFKDTYTKDASDAVLNAALTSWQQTAILQVLKDVFPNDILEEGQMLNEYFDMDELLSSTGKFVYCKIVVPRGFVMSVKSIGILLDTNNSFDVYIFNESRLAVINTQAVTATANTETWTAVETAKQDLWGRTSSLKSGIYYVGYFQEDITGSSIKRNFYKRGGVCGISYGEATPNGVSLPDYDTFSASGYTYGLNIDYVVRKDYSSYFLNSPDVFDTAIGYYVVIRMLEQILLTGRMNASERGVKDNLELSQIFAELNGYRSEESYYPGMYKRYDNEVKRIRNMFSVGKILTTIVQ